MTQFYGDLKQIPKEEKVDSLSYLSLSQAQELFDGLEYRLHCNQGSRYTLALAMLPETPSYVRNYAEALYISGLMSPGLLARGIKEEIPLIERSNWFTLTILSVHLFYESLLYHDLNK